MTLTTQPDRHDRLSGHAKRGLGPALHAQLDTGIINSATATGDTMNTTITTQSRIDRLADHARLGLRLAHLGATLDAIEDDADMYDYRDPSLNGLERRLDRAVEADDLAAVEGFCQALLDELQPV